jgi:hypothetical protein
MSWSAGDFANKARHPNVFSRLVENGTMLKHFDSVRAHVAIEMLDADGNDAAAERLRAFAVTPREELHEVLGYDS